MPYWHLLSCARGLERENDVVQARFDALREINPTHRKGYSHVLRRLAPKWGGTMDGMLPASPGSPASTPLPGRRCTAWSPRPWSRAA